MVIIIFSRSAFVSLVYDDDDDVVDNDGSNSFLTFSHYSFLVWLDVGVGAAYTREQRAGLRLRRESLKSVLINYPQVDSYFTRLFEPTGCSAHYDYTCARRARNERRTFVNYNARII